MGRVSAPVPCGLGGGTSLSSPSLTCFGNLSQSSLPITSFISLTSTTKILPYNCLPICLFTESTPSSLGKFQVPAGGTMSSFFLISYDFGYCLALSKYTMNVDFSHSEKRRGLKRASDKILAPVVSIRVGDLLTYIKISSL